MSSQSPVADSIYDKAFYESQAERSFISAKTTLRLLFDAYRPDSVVDVGCGVGTWVRAAKELGVQRVLGIDGDHVDRSMLMISKAEFVAADLESGNVLDVVPAEHGPFDLVISVEVAEHLAYRRAATFVGELSRLGDVILFSAAIPFQGGQHHVNEQWPEFWAILFSSFGFECYDPLRRMLWNKVEVDWWYAQNALIFVRGGTARDKDFRERWGPTGPLAAVHPQNYLDNVLKWHHVYRSAALDEELGDFVALRDAYSGGAHRLPALLAPARAVAEAGPDTFPNTRIVRSNPEAELTRSRSELDRALGKTEYLHERVGELERSNAELSADVRSLGEKYTGICSYVEAETSHRLVAEGLRAELDAVRNDLERAKDETERLFREAERLHEIERSRLFRLSQAYFRLYSAPVIGALLRSARRVTRLRREGKRLNTGRIPEAAEVTRSRPPLPLVAVRPEEIGKGVKVLSFPFPVIAPVRTVLVLKLDHIGDFVLGIPAFHRLRQGFPDARITLICGPWNRAIAEASGLFDEVISLALLPEVSGDHDPEAFRIDLAPIRALHLGLFDIAIDFRDHHDTRRVLSAVKARFRAGFYAPETATLVDLNFPNGGWLPSTERQVHHQILQSLLADAVVSMHSGRQLIGGALTRIAASEERWDLQPAAGMLVGMNLGSGVNAKNWPIERFVELASALIGRYNATIVLFGAAGQRAQSALLADQMYPGFVIDLTGKLTITQAIATFSSLSLYIGNDTGTTHIAAARGVPTVCLFGNLTSFSSHGVLGSRCISILANETGMTSISVAMVLRAVADLISGAPESIPDPSAQTGGHEHGDAPPGLVVIDNKPFHADFRKYLMRAAESAGGESVHVRCWKDVLVTHRGKVVDVSDCGKDPMLIAERISVLIGRRPFIILAGLGLDGESIPLVRYLRQRPFAELVVYDAFDYFRYHLTGEAYMKRIALEEVWRREADRIMVLERGLKCLYPGSFVLENASHLRRQSGTREAAWDKLVYIGSIDCRVDFVWLEALMDLDVTLDIYGRPHENEPVTAEELRLFVDRHDNVRFMGEYDNDELSGILSAYRIGIVPYKRLHSMTTHISPDKVYHYLNAGLEVIASDIPQTRRLERFLHLVRGKEDIAGALQAARSSPRATHWSPEENSWESRWSRLLELTRTADGLAGQPEAPATI